MVSNAPTMNIDVFPTLMTLAGAPASALQNIDGENIMPVMAENAPSPHEALFLFNNDRIVGVRSGKWKLVVETRYRAAQNSFEHSDYYGPDGLLFDLERDPSETYSYTREFPDVVERMRGSLVQGRRELNATALPQMWNRQ